MDLSSLQTFDLGEHGSVQLLSVPDAIDCFGSGLEVSHLDVDGRELFLRHSRWTLKIYLCPASRVSKRFSVSAALRNSLSNLLAKVDALQLKRLFITGSESLQQELAHPSVLLVEQLMSKSPLAELRLRDVQMQDESDWSLLAKMDPSVAVDL
ncbi:MAG: hypothetical protein BYD32DRAFT_466753 [Podila humilis]|nr:MAG: hypothetical protein BYD32DRAFT_466753 [Podila humilis]